MNKERSKSTFDAVGLLKAYYQQVLAGVLFVVTFVPTLSWMWDRWFARDSYYSHGILIPFVVGYLVWQKRDELAGLKKPGVGLGVGLIVFGLLIHIVSSQFRVYFSSGFAMLIVFYGMAVYFYGFDVFKRILFPMAFLVFMMPVPEVVITRVSFGMKLFAAEIATSILNGMGILAIREGSIIKMQSAYVVVDDVCSGLRSLISLMALGSIFAYWMKSSMVKRVALFLLTIPIAVVTNVMRVIFLSAIADIWGAEYATGFTHDVSGFIVFALAFVLLYFAMQLLE